MIRRWRRHRHSVAPEMNITAFMNLMVILVPFLLMTAVFSRLAILQLELPDNSAAEAGQDVDKGLIVIVRQGEIQLRYLARQIQVIEKNDQDFDWSLLSRQLQYIKSVSPDETGATILLEPDISYELLVRVMDVLRSGSEPGSGTGTGLILFPDISIGDAAPPVISGSQ